MSYYNQFAGHLAGAGVTTPFPNLYGWRGDGVNQNLSLGSVSSHKYMHGANNTAAFQFSISLWTKLDVPEPDALYGLFSTAALTLSDVGLSFFFDDRTVAGFTRALRIFIARGVGGAPVLNGSIDAAYPNDSNAHHICVTYDQALATANAKIYVDAVLKGSINKTANTPSTANSAQAPKWGSLGNNGSPLDGQIFHQKLFTQALTALEVAEDFALGGGDVRTTSYAGKVFSAYHFPNGAADYPTQTDYVGSFNATMQNGSSADIVLW